MYVPEAFQRKLKQVDRNLEARWNNRIKRFQIVLHNSNPCTPPKVVKTVARPEGGFMPLDQRTITWLYKADVHRRFAGRREDVIPQLIEKQLADEQAEYDRQKAKKENDQWDEVFDKVSFEFKRLDKKGMLFSHAMFREMAGK